MPGQINFPEKLAADIDTPPTGYAAVYVNTSGVFAIKDDTGTSTTVQGVTDGDKGDITVSSSGATWTIDNSAVTLAKIANIATDRLLGRDTASSGVVEELTVGGGIEFTGSGGIQRSALTGDVTATAGSGTTTIANDAVTYAKIQNVSATSRILGRISSGAGDVEELTGIQVAGIAQGDGLDADAAGFRGIPQNSQSGNYTTVAADAGKHIIHPSGGGAGDTYTIDSNANVAYEIGTAITFINADSNSVSIAITSDTMTLAGTTSTGTRTLAQNGIATAIKIGTTSWLINGTGLS